MEIDIAAICKMSGLNQREMSALIGESHTTLSRIKVQKKHRPMTVALYWLLKTVPRQAVSTLLDRWLYEKPKDEQQTRLLIKIARRFKLVDEAKKWERVIRSQNPEFFF